MIKKVKSFNLELTNHCDLNCDFCANSFMTRQKGFMDAELAKRIIAEVKKNKFCNRIAVNVMGEPLLYPDLGRILEYAHKIKQGILLITNGSSLDRETALMLFEHPPEVVAISYHSGSDSSFKYRHASISYDEYKENIFKFIEMKFQMKAKTHIDINSISTIHKQHTRFQIMDSMEEIRQFEKDWLGFAHSMQERYSLRSKIPRSILPGMNYLLPGFSISFHLSYHLWSNSLLPAGTKLIQARKCFCPIVHSQCNVLWNGDLTLCPVDYNGDLVYANVDNKSVIEEFNSTRAKEIRDCFVKGVNIPQKCANCRGMVRNIDGSEYVFPKRHFEPTHIEKPRATNVLFRLKDFVFHAAGKWQGVRQ